MSLSVTHVGSCIPTNGFGTIIFAMEIATGVTCQDPGTIKVIAGHDYVPLAFLLIDVMDLNDCLVVDRVAAD